MSFPDAVLGLVASGGTDLRVRVAAATAAGACLAIAFGWALRPATACIDRRPAHRGLASRLRDVVGLVAIVIATVGSVPAVRASLQARLDARRTELAALRREAALDERFDAGLEQLLAQQRSTPPALENLWKQAMRDVPFPLGPMDDATVDAFVESIVAGYDEDMRRRGWPADARARHCDYRLWSPQHGSPATPLLAWVFRPSDQARFGADEKAAYFGIARSSAGDPVGVSAAQWGPQVEVESGLDLLSRFFFTPGATAIGIAPPPEAEDAEPSPYATGDVLQEYLRLDAPLDLAVYARRDSATFRPTPEDGRFELTIATAQGTVALAAELHEFGDVPTAERTAERRAALRLAFEASGYVDGGPGVPVDIRIHDAELDADGRIPRLAVAFRSRAYRQWLADHPGSTRRHATLVLRPLPGTVVDGAERDFAYATNYAAEPRLLGRLRCTGDPPGELRNLVRWLRSRPPASPPHER